MANSELVHKTVTHDHSYSKVFTAGERSLTSIRRQKQTTPPSSQPSVGCMPGVWQRFRNLDIPEETSRILMASWRVSTQKQYSTYQDRWFKFCSRKQIDSLHPSVNQVLDFLTSLYNAGLSYSTINTARSSLSALLDHEQRNTIGSHPLISRFLKGIFELRTPSPRYTTIWDVSIVLNYLRSLHPTSSLTLKQLTHKLVMLIALLSAQRLQTLQLLDVNNLHLDGKEAVFFLPNKLKQSRPGSNPLRVVLASYQADMNLDVYHVLQHYINVTSSLRGAESQLFISYVPPHKPVTRNTLSRWIKLVLEEAGVDVVQYAAHSTRAASTSAADSRNLPVDDILRTVGWASERTFAQYYKKPIVSNKTFAMAVLDA